MRKGATLIMKVKTDIRRLCDGLSEEFYRDLEVGPSAAAGESVDLPAAGETRPDVERQSDMERQPDVERIRRLALAKIHSQNAEGEKGDKNKMKRAPYKILIAVAIIVVLTTTAFAAGGLDFFRVFFGSSVENAGNAIQELAVSAKDENYEMTAEQLISDGYSTKVIVSLRPLTKEAAKWLEKANQVRIEAEVTGGDDSEWPQGVVATASDRMPEFDTEDKYYVSVSYDDSRDRTGMPLHLTLASLEQRKWSSDETVVLAQPDLSLTIDQPQSMNGRREIALGIVTGGKEDTEGGDAAEGGAEDPSASRILSLEISPISAVLNMQTPAGSTDTPTMDVILVMEDGRQESIFETGWVEEGATGGGGAVIGGNHETMPLSSGNSYSRDLETGKVLQTSTFSRIINTDDVAYVLVNGERYDF